MLVEISIHCSPWNIYITYESLKFKMLAYKLRKY